MQLQILPRQVLAADRARFGRTESLRPQFLKRTYTPVRSPKLRGKAVSQEKTLENAKAEIAKLSGNKNGTDKSPEEKETIAKIASSLGDLETLKILDMPGTKWQLVFTNNTTPSAGKIGPFVGKVVQDFLADKPGQFINWLYLGPVTISLLGTYKQPSKEKIVVGFKWIQAELGVLKWRQDLKNGAAWNLVYTNDDYRVLRATNNKNIGDIFVLEKIKE